MRKFISILITIVFLSLLFYKIAFAESSYVLPYPAAMPGTFSYKLHLVYEKFEKYWYFGNFAQFDYNLKESDKYLVESKTLFEYKQYLLAYKALNESDKYFKEVPIYLNEAKKENKNIIQKEILLKKAALKHIEYINEIEKITPSNFTWNPERAAVTHIDIKKLLENSIDIRKQVL